MVLFSEDHIQETKRRGRIEVICGSMFSGKTEELIRRLKRAKFAKQRVEIFNPGCASTHPVWALPRSLATTGGIIDLFSLPAGTKMFQFPAFAS